MERRCLAELMISVVILSPCSLRAQGIPPGFGVIAGRVLDAAGQPVDHAEVDADMVAGPGGRRHSVYSEQDGSFRIDLLPPGEYVVRASKEKEGYPDAYFAFFASGKGSAPSVQVRGGQIVQRLRLRSRQPAATLEGRVVAVDNGLPIQHATITLYRQDNPKIYVLFGANQPRGRSVY